MSSSLEDLQNLFRVGSRPHPGARFEAREQVVISITMPDGSMLHIQTQEVEISFDRDFTEVTTRSDAQRVYQVDRGTFTIKGRL